MADARMSEALTAVATFARTVKRADLTSPADRESCYRALWVAAVTILEARPPVVADYLSALRDAAVREGLRPASVDSRIRLARERKAAA